MAFLELQSTPPVPMSTNIDATTIQYLTGQAIDALFSGRADLAEEPLNRLSAVLPNHPSIMSLRQRAAVIGFEWPAQRNSYTPAWHKPPVQSNIDLVAFHANLPVVPSGLHQQIDYLSVLALSFESAFLRAPNARRILLTDESTPVPSDLKVDEVMRFPMDPTKLMYERMRVQTLYLQGRPLSRCSVLLDSDVVVSRDVSEIFTKDFDVGLTWRSEFPDAPFNGGIIFVGCGDHGLRFFQEAMSCYGALAESSAVAPYYSRDLRAWWGDQFALAALVGHRNFAQRPAEPINGTEINGVRVCYFPCSEYNFTLEANVNYTPEILANKFFIHFKGNRKAMQAHYLAAMRAGRV